MAEALCAALAAGLRTHASGRGWFWIDDGGYGAPRRSYLGISPETIAAHPGEEQAFTQTLTDRWEAERPPAGSAHAGSLAADEPFGGGWVVALSYEFGVRRMGIPVDYGEGPPALALCAPVVIVVDHATGDVRVVGEVDSPSGPELMRVTRNIVRDASQGISDRAENGAFHGVDESEIARAAWRFDDAQYERLIGDAQRLIADGEAYVLCLTNQALVHTADEDRKGVGGGPSAERDGSSPPDPLDTFLRLRATSDAPRAGLIVHGDTALLSASPERFLERRGSRIRTVPIKGTRPRSVDPHRDDRLARELAADPKERAENTMIVDLLRNDLHRVCEPDSVRVPSLCVVESYRQVHQLVSVIDGELSSEATLWEAIDALFPGGSMTGAPKQRAIEHLARLEGGPRGFYSGCFGWIGSDGGSAGLAMTIRSIEFTGGRVQIGAGGGITSDSQPAAEITEVHLKARAMLAALAPRRTRYP